MSIVVAVDGPAGSGKGTITKRIEKEMGLVNLDTGATYRCVALETIRKGYDVNEEEKSARVIVPDDQLSLAIGKSGQNARLAARLTGWKIDIKSETQFREMLSQMQQEAEETDGDLEEESNEE